MLTQDKSSREAVITVLLLLSMSTLILDSHGEYVIKVSTGTASVNLSGDLVQAVPNSAANNTADPFQSFPPIRFHLENQNASILSPLVDSAIRKLSPGATTKGVTMDAKSNSTRIHYDLTFQINGLGSAHGIAEFTDLAWRSFVIQDDFKVNNQTVNGALADYLGKIISFYARAPEATAPPLVQRRTWYWNDQRIEQNEVVPTITGVMLLNFTGLSKPLETWTATIDPQHMLYKYRASTGFNLTRINAVIEPEGTTNLAQNVVHKVDATIEVPWEATPSGNGVITDNGWGASLMLTIIVSSGLILAGSFVFERRLRRPRNQIKDRRINK